MNITPKTNAAEIIIACLKFRSTNLNATPPARISKTIPIPVSTSAGIVTPANPVIATTIAILTSCRAITKLLPAVKTLIACEIMSANTRENC